MTSLEPRSSKETTEWLLDALAERPVVAVRSALIEHPRASVDTNDIQAS